MRIERFEIEVVDERGERHTLHGIRRFRSYPTLSDGTTEVAGLAELFDRSGSPINANGDGTFDCVLSGRKYRLAE